MLKAEAKLRLRCKLLYPAETSQSIRFIQASNLRLLVCQHRSEHLISFLLLGHCLSKPAFIPDEVVVNFNLIRNLLVKLGLDILLSLGFLLTLALKLQLIVAAVDSLHFLILVDDEEHGWICVHESNMGELNLKLPEFDQVLGSRELEKEQAVLLRGEALIR